MKELVDHVAARKKARSLAPGDKVGSIWGMEIVEVQVGFAQLRMQTRANMLNGHEIVHGGITFALADTALAYTDNFLCGLHGDSVGVHCVSDPGAPRRCT